MIPSQEYAARLAAMDQDIARGEEMVDTMVAWVKEVNLHPSAQDKLVFMSVLATYAHTLLTSLEQKDVVLLLVMLLDRLGKGEEPAQS